MSSRSRVTVARDGNGWTVHQDGRELSHHRLQGRAIDVARDIAQGRPTEVTVQGRDGRFREGWTYGGADPFPPRG